MIMSLIYERFTSAVLYALQKEERLGHHLSLTSAKTSYGNLFGHANVGKLQSLHRARKPRALGI